MSSIIPDGIDVHAARLAVAYAIAFESLRASNELYKNDKPEDNAARLTNLIVEIYTALESNSPMPLPGK